jgi:hypothetical protein
MAELSETQKSKRRWTLAVSIVILVIVAFAVYSCAHTGLKESPSVVLPFLL